MNVFSRMADGDVTLSVRETRMIVERILLTTGLPDGIVPAVGNCVLYSTALRLGGLAAFENAINAITAARLGDIKVAADRVLDSSGNHAWLVATDALDLALADHRRGGSGVLEVRNAREPNELRLIEGLAERHRARVEVLLTGTIVRLRVVADLLPGEDAVMLAALRDGFPTSRALWRRLYDRSGGALTPDSIESRRHAGPVMVDAHGRIHGRDDDDTDFELLLGQKSAPSNQ
jgi:hypothetical protein